MNKSFKLCKREFEIACCFNILIGIWHTRYFFFMFCPAIIWTRETSLSCRTDICSCKLSAKLSLMLDNPFSVPSFWKLSQISIWFIQISTKFTCKQLIPFKESHVFFWNDPQCFGPLSKQNIEISTETARVSRLSFRFLWLCSNKSPWVLTLQILRVFCQF